MASAAVRTVAALNGFSCLFILHYASYCKRRCASYNCQYNYCSHGINSFLFLYDE